MVSPGASASQHPDSFLEARRSIMQYLVIQAISRLISTQLVSKKLPNSPTALTKAPVLLVFCSAKSASLWLSFRRRGSSCEYTTKWKAIHFNIYDFIFIFSYYILTVLPLSRNDGIIKSLISHSALIKMIRKRVFTNSTDLYISVMLVPYIWSVICLLLRNVLIFVHLVRRCVWGTQDLDPP